MSSVDIKEIDIKGIDKIELLEALFKATITDDDYMSCDFDYYDSQIDDRVVFNHGKAKIAVKGYIEHFNNHYMKCDLTGDTCNPEGYDSHYGKGAFKKIVKSLKEKDIKY